MAELNQQRTLAAIRSCAGRPDLLGCVCQVVQIDGHDMKLG